MSQGTQNKIKTTKKAHFAWDEQDQRTTKGRKLNKTQRGKDRALWDDLSA